MFSLSAVKVAVLDPTQAVGAASASLNDSSTTTSASSKADQKPNAWRWEESDDSLAAYGALGGLLLLGNLLVLQGQQVQVGDVSACMG